MSSQLREIIPDNSLAGNLQLSDHVHLKIPKPYQRKWSAVGHASHLFGFLALIDGTFSDHKPYGIWFVLKWGDPPSHDGFQYEVMLWFGWIGGTPILGNLYFKISWTSADLRPAPAPLPMDDTCRDPFFPWQIGEARAFKRHKLWLPTMTMLGSAIDGLNGHLWYSAIDGLNGHDLYVLRIIHRHCSMPLCARRGRRVGHVAGSGGRRGLGTLAEARHVQRSPKNPRQVNDFVPRLRCCWPISAHSRFYVWTNGKNAWKIEYHHFKKTSVAQSEFDDFFRKWIGPTGATSDFGCLISTVGLAEIYVNAERLALLWKRGSLWFLSVRLLGCLFLMSKGFKKWMPSTCRPPQTTCLIREP